MYAGGGVPGNSDRRASDPTSTRDQSTSRSFQIQYFGSQNNITHLPPFDADNFPCGTCENKNHKNYKSLKVNIQSG